MNHIILMSARVPSNTLINASCQNRGERTKHSKMKPDTHEPQRTNTKDPQPHKKLEHLAGAGGWIIMTSACKRQNKIPLCTQIVFCKNSPRLMKAYAANCAASGLDGCTQV